MSWAGATILLFGRRPQLLHHVDLHGSAAVSSEAWHLTSPRASDPIVSILSWPSLDRHTLPSGIVFIRRVALSQSVFLFFFLYSVALARSYYHAEHESGESGHLVLFVVSALCDIWHCSTANHVGLVPLPWPQALSSDGTDYGLCWILKGQHLQISRVLFLYHLLLSSASICLNGVDLISLDSQLCVLLGYLPGFTWNTPPCTVA